jgi:N-acetylglucosaminyl-diphospho-decaprenol L-rhamnosyltransferase
LRRKQTLLRATGLSFTHWPVVDEYVSAPEAYEYRHVVDWVLGAALLVRTECHKQLSGWDESFFLYSEETDFSLRAADAGWQTVYEPAAVVTHIGGQSGRSPRLHTMQIVNRVRVYARRHGRLASWAYFALTLASEMSWLVRGNRDARSSIPALIIPRRRPAELGCSNSLLPT